MDTLLLPFSYVSINNTVVNSGFIVLSLSHFTLGMLRLERLSTVKAQSCIFVFLKHNTGFFWGQRNVNFVSDKRKPPSGI